MQWLAHVSVLNKIVLAFLVVLGVTALIGFNGLQNIETLTTLTSGIYLEYVKPAIAINKALTLIRNVRLEVYMPFGSSKTCWG